ncbi:MAG: hypothetical protein ABI723_18925 [Bacteroidia bacterium]
MIKYKLFKCCGIISLCKISAGIILCTIFFNRCNEYGCTDPASINYNTAANKDDGSCIYCDSTNKQYATKTILLSDYNPASAYYNQVVAKFIFDQDSLNYNDQSCGNNTCMVYLHIQNLVNQEMEFTYLISSVGPLGISSSRPVIIPANSTYNADTVHAGNTCSDLNNSIIYVTELNSYIVYH